MKKEIKIFLRMFIKFMKEIIQISLVRILQLFATDTTVNGLYRSVLTYCRQ